MIDVAPVGVVGIDRRSGLPYYYQLRDILLNQLDTWEAGYKLPSEGELCEAYGVSRTVVRQALDDLASQGLLHKVKGKGTFVTGRKLDATFVQRAAGFHDEMTALGHAVRSRTLVQEVRPASVRVAAKLDLSIDDPVVQLDRVRHVDGEPNQVVRTSLPRALCPGLEAVDMEDRSLYAELAARYGIRPTSGRRTIEATAATPMDAEWLGVDAGAPVLLMESVTADRDDRPFEYFVAVYRGDKSKLHIELQAP